MPDSSDSRLELRIVEKRLQYAAPRVMQIDDEPSIIVGRSQDAHIVVRSELVARRHARLSDRDGRLWLNDLGSTNGTLVNGERIRDVGIDVGDSFVVGEVTLTVLAHRPVIERSFETDESAFLVPIHRDPDDEMTREVYGDFLEEKSQVLRAEWLRVELACRRTSNPTEREAARNRLYELTRRLRNAPRWRMLVARPHIEGCTRPQCTTRWGLLPFGKSEEVRLVYVRECGACASYLSYRDAYEESLTSYPPSPSGGSGIIAIDHVVTRGGG